MRRTIAALLLLGLAVSGYLLSRHFELLTGGAQRSVCSALLHLDCDEALSSPASKFAGLPLAGWGIVYFGTLGALLMIGSILGEATSALALRASLAVSLVGAAAAAVLLALMAFGRTPFCPLCAAVHAIVFALVPLLARASGRPIRALPGEIRAACVAVVRAPGPVEPPTRLALAGLLSVALAALVMFQSVFTLESQHQPPKPDSRLAVGAYAMGPRVSIPEDDRDVLFGAAAADMRFVVFGDFECAGCRLFARRLAKTVAASRGRVNAVFKHFPIDPACNRGATEARHPRACAAARAAEAARVQGRFQEFHDALFAADGPLSDDVLDGAARSAGLDVARLRADVDAASTRKKIANDVELGIRLNVEETPTVFLNGRRVPDISPPALDAILMSLANDSAIPLPSPEARASAGDQAAGGR